VVVASVALALAGCGGTSATPSTSVGTASAAPVVRQGPSTGDVLVQGTVTGVDRSAGPTSVAVMVWPIDDGTAKVGDKVETMDLPPVPVDASGHWAVELDPATVTSDYLTADSALVNFDIQVMNESAGTSWGTTAFLVDEPGVWRSDGAGVADRAIDVSMDFGAQQVTLTDSLGEATTSPLTLAPRG
jgi:hypothetical protein